MPVMTDCYPFAQPHRSVAVPLDLLPFPVGETAEAWVTVNATTEEAAMAAAVEYVAARTSGQFDTAARIKLAIRLHRDFDAEVTQRIKPKQLAA